MFSTRGGRSEFASPNFFNGGRSRQQSVHVSLLSWRLRRRLLSSPLPPPPLLTISAQSRARSPLRASRRFSNHRHEPVVVVPVSRPWITRELHDHTLRDDDDDDEDDDEEEDDRSLDLLVRFLHSMFRKISRQARKSARSVLPPSISTKLVRFFVNGVLILTFLWILKAFLEVVCTFGSMVFVSILVVRGIWSAVAYIKESHYYYTDRMDDENGAWNSLGAAT